MHVMSDSDVIRYVNIVRDCQQLFIKQRFLRVPVTRVNNMLPTTHVLTTTE